MVLFLIHQAATLGKKKEKKKLRKRDLERTKEDKAVRPIIQIFYYIIPCLIDSVYGNISCSTNYNPMSTTVLGPSESATFPSVSGK